MKAYAIAQIIHGGKVVGYTIYDVESKKTVLSPMNNLINALSKDSSSFKNIALVNGEVVGTNGKLDRYARVNTNGTLLDKKAPVVVLHRLGDVGYELVDYKGTVIKVSLAEAVKYAKELGIANGKIVTQDNIERISSITDSYEVIEIKKSKDGSNTRVSIPIRTDSNMKKVADDTKKDVETEIEYNDVFKAMTKEQREVLKQYYAWYTVDAYKKLAKNARLEVAPAKAAQLAKLRGKNKWLFAGINDSYLEGNFKAHCELGHRLRYEYFAIPEDAMEDNDKIRTREISEGGYRNRYVGGFRTNRDTLEDLRERGAIVFGETCAGDFFNIATADMAKLVKTRKAMSDEIETMSNVLTNNLLTEYQSKSFLLIEIINKLGSVDKVVEAFGDNIGNTLLAFMKAKMPFPESLVILAGDEVRKDIKAFWSLVFPEFSGMLNNILNGQDLVYALEGTKFAFDFISKYTIEGEYAYDPLNDNNNRKDIGRYNKETRGIRKNQCQTLYRVASLYLKEPGKNNKFNLNILEKYLKIIKYMLGVNEVYKLRYDKSELLKEKFSSIEKFISYLENNIVNELIDNNVEGCNNSIIEQVNLMMSLKMFSDKTKGMFLTNGYEQRGNYIYSNSSYTFRHAVKNYGTHYIHNMGGIDDVVRSISIANAKASELVDNVIRLVENKINEELENEKKKTFYYRIEVHRDLDLEKFDNERRLVVKCDYITNEEFKKAYDLGSRAVKNNSYALNANEIEIDGESYSVLVNMTDIYTCNPIDIDDYNYYIGEIQRVKKSRIEFAKRIEENRKREDARLEELRKQQEKEAEEKARVEQANRDKLERLKKLIDEHPELSDDRGVLICKDILKRGVKYEDMSDRQKWRIDKTLDMLSAFNKDAVNEETTYNFDDNDVEKVESNDNAIKKETLADVFNSSSQSVKSGSESLNEIFNTEDDDIDYTGKTLEDLFEPVNYDDIQKNDGIDKEIRKMIDTLLDKVSLKTEKDGDIRFAYKVSITVNRTGKISDKQRTFLEKGYKKLMNSKE